jgi:hypothetical protein
LVALVVPDQLQPNNRLNRIVLHTHPIAICLRIFHIVLLILDRISCYYNKPKVQLRPIDEDSIIKSTFYHLYSVHLETLQMKRQSKKDCI